MQFSRYITYSKNDSSYGWVPWVIKIIIAIGSLYYVLSKLFAESVAITEIGQYFLQWSFLFVVAVVMLLMVINWWLEATKWKLLAKPFQQLSILEAGKAIMAGITLDSVLPLGTGGVAGKVLSVKNENRNQLVLPVVLGQGLQSFWTVVLGTIGLYQLAGMTNLGKLYVVEERQWLMSALLFFAAIGMVVLWPKLIKKMSRSIAKYSPSVWLVLGGLSLLRYLVFLTQLLLLAYFMSGEVPISVLLGCSTWMFFAKTIVPKPGHLGALGIRGAAAVFFLSLAGYSYTGFVLATFVLWVINLAIPTLLGIFFVKELNLSTDTK